MRVNVNYEVSLNDWKSTDITFLNSISIIIPVYNEANGIGHLVRHLIKYDPEKSVSEIIVVDGGSTDTTRTKAREAGATIMSSDEPGRAVQMNTGAKTASGDILYFLHADSYPPRDYVERILESWHNGFHAGCFRLRFDTRHWLLNLYSWFTRFPFRPFRYGDQSLYIDRDLFYKIDGFRDDLIVMEDNEIIGRITRHTNFRIMDSPVTTSARKYLDNGIIRLQFIFTCVYLMYYLGFSQTTIVRFYKKTVRNGKKPVSGQKSEVHTPYTHALR